MGNPLSSQGRAKVAEAAHKRGLESRRALLLKYWAYIKHENFKHALRVLTPSQRAMVEYYLASEVTFEQCSDHFNGRQANMCRALFVQGMQRIAEEVMRRCPMENDETLCEQLARARGGYSHEARAWASYKTRKARGENVMIVRRNGKFKVEVVV